MSENPNVTLVLGGARSGKSALAENLVLAAAEGRAPQYIATSEAWDDEMRTRIAAHKAQREGRGWVTHEAPVDVSTVLRRLDPRAPVLLDCLTLWLTNVILQELNLDDYVQDLADAVREREAPLVMVANEVGLGIVPDNALARRFRDEAGRLNQRMAAQAGRVVFVAAGLPLVLKGSL